MSVSLETLALAKKYTDTHGGGSGGAPIDDAHATTTNPWSGSKINSELEDVRGDLGVDDTEASEAKPWSGSKVQDELDNAKGVYKTITLSTTWAGSGPYTQAVTASGYTVTANTKVDLVPNSTVVTQMVTDGTEQIFIQNDNAVLTAYAIGKKPTAALTVQVLYTEVNT